MKIKAAAALSCLALLAACGSDTVRFSAPEPMPVARQGIAYRTVEVRDVSLPTHARDEEISVSDATGRLTGNSDSLWADDPQRAITLGISRALSEITGARVAPEPWPFLERASASVDIRFETLMPQDGGVYVARGMFFVAPEAEGRPDRSRSFAIEQPFDPAGGFPAIAAARSAIVSQLAQQIAAEGLR